MVLKKEQQAGVCISCGRRAGLYERACPYCGETVWLPLWRRIGRRVVPSGMAIVSMLAVASAGATHIADAGRRISQNPVSAFLLAAGIGLCGLPSELENERIVRSRRSALNGQVRAFSLSCLTGGTVSLCTLLAVETQGRSSALLVCALLSVIGGAFMPFLFRVPLRCLAAAGLTVCAWLIA